jgi:glutathione synthase/RimK-type ligase-like ATP-grasp enzyme
MKIGIITCEDLSRYFESSEDPLITHDDLVMVSCLRSRGHEVVAIPWGQEVSSLQDYDVFVVRSPWDYMDSPSKREGLFTWLKELDSLGKPIENPVGLMLWNLDKHYLKDLSDQGIEIVETKFIEPSSALNKEVLRKHFNEFGAFVLKPCISAAAKDTFLVSSLESIETLEDANGKVEGDMEDWRAGRGFMIQPFIKSIKSFGEWSLVFLNGEYSHSVRKIPKSGEWLVQDELGGSVRWEEAPQNIVDKAKIAVNAIQPAYESATSNKLSKPPLYARIDLLIADDGSPLLGEIEMVEPELFFKMREPEETVGFEPAIEYFSKQLEDRHNQI